MAKVSICKRVGTILQPNNDGVELANSPNSRVIYIIIDDKVCNDQAQCRIDSMSESNVIPG
jgi:hypothetical protein